MHIFYLHGFASSPMSTKAQFLAERLAARGLTLQCPDFNLPDFSTLTMSRMLQQTEERIAMMMPGNVMLIGSSMGGFVAVEAAARAVNQARHPITQLILLAPAVELEWERLTEVGPGEPATPKQLIAMRFASDDELPGLCRAVLNDKTMEQKAIKKMIKNWRPDHLRA